MKPMVLVIDDDPFFQKILDETLPTFGLEVLMFKNIPDFLKATQNYNPKLLLIDLHLGEQYSGFDVLEKLRNEFKMTVPILIISGNEEPRAIAHALELGANDYLIKPFDRHFLKAKLALFLKSSALSSIYSTLVKVPEDQSSGSLTSKCYISKIDEMGIELFGKHMISKGTKIELTGKFFQELSGSNASIRATVASNRVDPSGEKFYAYAEFPPDQLDFLESVRKWIFNQNKNLSH